MDVDLTPATPDHDPVLARLFQLYSYDFSEILGLEVGDDGVFPTGSRPSGYWRGPRYRPFLLRAGAHLAGFAIVGAESRLTGDALWDMDQFSGGRFEETILDDARWHGPVQRFEATSPGS